MSDVLTIESGDRVRIDSVSGAGARLPTDRDRFPVLPDHAEILHTLRPELGPHILTGPIHVAGARPGDVLRVEIDSVSLRQNWGWNEIAAGCGVIPELEVGDESIIIPIDLESTQLQLPWATTVPAAPLFGILPVKPAATAGRITTVIPGLFGGNIDIRHLLPDMEVFFPVFVDGAGFSAGDGHALQGDGEVNGTAVETSLSGTFKLTLLRGTGPMAFPYAILNRQFLTKAFDEDLNIALRIAVRSAIDLLADRFGLSAREAYRHCSILGNAAVSQAVNVRQGIHFILPFPT